MPDPLDELRLPLVPAEPDPMFASALRRRLEQVLFPTPTHEEQPMSDVMTRDGLSRNGTRHGDVSYITLAVPDIGRARAFYGSVLGWRLAPGRVDADHAGQVDDVIPMVGLWSDPNVPEYSAGATLGFRVDDLSRAVAAVTAAGGSAGEITEEPYGLASICDDGRGLRFYLHQLPAGGGPAGANGAAPGDVSYISLLVPDRDRALRFFASVLGWAPELGPNGQAVGPIPDIGLGERPEPTVILSYLVDDIAGAIERVRRSGGTSTDVLTRPYGLEAECRDDQGVAFYLHEFPA